jgi:putative intracellular protease/amidase
MGEQAIRVEKKAVSDGKIVTGKSAGAVYDFVFEIVKNVEGEEALENLKKRMYY